MLFQGTEVKLVLQKKVTIKHISFVIYKQKPWAAKHLYSTREAKNNLNREFPPITYVHTVI